MSLIVQKFGGTSVASTDRIKKVAQLIRTTVANGDQVAVVVSAMAGVTNQLITLCNEVSNLDSTASLAEYDTALCSGEMVASALLALSLQALNIPARSILAWQLPIITDSTHNHAIVQSVNSDILKECIAQKIVPIIAGFQGITQDKYCTTFGRGGSDTTASMVAAAISADLCDIYTDVEGVFTADPNIVPNAIRLSNITFEEMLAMASGGAKVLHPRCVEIAMRYKIPIRVLSSFNQVTGGSTLITHRNKIMEQRIITGITANKDLFKLDIDKSVIDFLDICCALTQHNIHIEFMLNTSQSEYNFIIPLSDKKKLESLLSDMKLSFTLDVNISTISVIGYGIKNDYSLIHKILAAIAAESISVFAAQVSEIQLTLFANDVQTEKITRICHKFLE